MQLKTQNIQRPTLFSELTSSNEKLSYIQTSTTNATYNLYNSLNFSVNNIKIPLKNKNISQSHNG